MERYGALWSAMAAALDAELGARHRLALKGLEALLNFVKDRLRMHSRPTAV
jgi:hypothetical protein